MTKASINKSSVFCLGLTVLILMEDITNENVKTEIVNCLKVTIIKTNKCINLFSIMIDKNKKRYITSILPVHVVHINI